ncbi:PRA1 family protein 3-like isoform X1 [Acropora millepora]|uniref:PRA1 family protein 3-like isoform X1 n=1 Tax=Acropora millepora TaxID=45264 RepID=UPI001CF39533|nr:PRA1 family protein 3-like isoform X1 [Acropora millepora]
MAVALPPMRSLRDFLTDAQFSCSTFNNMDRMNNRIIKNLIYYQSNYILTVIVIFLLVGFLHPKDFLIGTISVAVTLTVFAVVQSHTPQLAKIKRQYPLLVPVAVLGSAVLVVHALASILVFLWGFVMPLAGGIKDKMAGYMQDFVMLHAATRKRNVKNKFANTVEVFKEDVSPMNIIL